MIEATMTLFDRIFDKTLLARRINLVACNVIKESDVPESEGYEQLSLFDTEETIQDRADDEKALEKERALQEAMLRIKHRFGKNSVLKAANYTEGATAKERNRQIGGHRA
jgi:DNA polymerase V